MRGEDRVWARTAITQAALEVAGASALIRS